MKFVKLTAIDLRSERAARDAQNPSPSNVELDDLERPVAPTTPAEIPEIKTYPVNIAVAAIREFYPRKGDRVGTRIVYMNGAAQPVTETVAEVEAQLNSLNN